MKSITTSSPSVSDSFLSSSSESRTRIAGRGRASWWRRAAVPGRRVVPWLSVGVIPGLLALGGCGAGQGAPDPEVVAIGEAIGERLREFHAAGDFPGATVGFVLADGRSGGAAVGMADLEEGREMQPTDRMLAGSIGKTYLAAVVMQLVGEGKLGLDDPVSRWLGDEPWFGRLPNGSELTVRMLMNHTSGIAEHVQDRAFQEAILAAPDRVWAPAELVEFILDRPALFAPATDWSYADTNYILVGMIVERVTGRPFYEDARERLLEPLGLAATSPSDRPDLPGLVPGYIDASFNPFDFPNKMVEGGRLLLNPQFEWTGGGFVTTSEELARWAKASYEGRAFPQELVDTLLASVPAKTGRGDRYGLGVQVKQSEFGVTYGHSGWFPGYLSEVRYFPEHGIAVAVQFNTDFSRKLGAPIRRYLEEVARIVIAASGAEGV